MMGASSRMSLIQVLLLRFFGAAVAYSVHSLDDAMEQGHHRVALHSEALVEVDAMGVAAATHRRHHRESAVVRGRHAHHHQHAAASHEGAALIRREQQEQQREQQEDALDEEEEGEVVQEPNHGKEKDSVSESEAVKDGVGKPTMGALFPVLLGAILSFFLLGIIALGAYRPSAPPAAEGGEGGEGEALAGGGDIIKEEAQPLEEDLYGIAIASLVRDTKVISQNTPTKMLRISRVLSTILLVCFCVTLQIFLLQQLKFLVSAVSVTEIRALYSKYEVIMYGNNTDNLFKTPNGFWRGIPKHFNASLFELVSEEDKEQVCRIPLSQPTFLMCLLLIWAFTVTADVRGCCELAFKLVWTTPTVASMEESTEDREEEQDGVTVVGLTKTLKASMVLLIFLPRVAVDLFLLYLGCRWLTATPSFEDLLLNAVALEFILILQEIMVRVLVSQRNRYEASVTYVLPVAKERPFSPKVITGTFAWGVVAIIFVLLYMYKLQQVLPMYNWDVRAVCMSYLEELASGKNE
eukprot:TRINITY_DN26300_c0_g1_i1.p1 TRINITY_DN26300_c0_g1~~TRINITY_DN26300_c0_g1_i1.p1  ORF type:complete len:522 (-),score=100.46 TRINITY_DN26300_c0_g1_i1:113-1678(-)